MQVILTHAVPHDDRKWRRRFGDSILETDDRARCELNRSRAQVHQQKIFRHDLGKKVERKDPALYDTREPLACTLQLYGH